MSLRRCVDGLARATRYNISRSRSEEHTSELQSQSNLVCRLLLEKKNNNVFRKFSALHGEAGRLNVDGMNIISNDCSINLDRSSEAMVSYTVHHTITARLPDATTT